MTTLVISLMSAIFCASVTAMALYTVRTADQRAMRSDIALSQWMELLSQSQTAAITQVAEAIGKSVQLSVTPLPPPPPPIDQIRDTIESAMVRFEQPDLSDPTDGAAWLAPSRDTVAMIDPNDPEPYGIPGLKPLHHTAAV